MLTAQSAFARDPFRVALLTAMTVAAYAQVAMAQDPPVRFEDVSGRLNFVHRSGEFGGDGLGGAAWFDFDNDGLLDLFLTNGKTQPNALFKNMGNGAFVDVAAAARVANGLGNSGVIAADIDNDGFKDLFLTGDGGVMGTGESPMKLYHNLGNGTFADITLASGITLPLTNLSAAFGDIDNDGFLDLFIGAVGSLATGSQHRNALYHNNGDLTFTEIAAAAGVNSRQGACASFFSDCDNDGLIDLFVANCNEVNFRPTPIELFRNNGDLTFADQTQPSGLWRGGFWMGVGPADFDNDGDIDIFATNLGAPANRRHALYRNNGDGTYTNVASAAGAANFEFGWGCVMTDFDNDGFADIFMAGSLPAGGFGIIGPGLGNPGTLLFNDRNGAFDNHTASMPVNLASRFTSGVAHGDFDNDGFVDIVVVVETWAGDPGTPVLLRNLGNKNNHVTVRLQGTVSNRDAVGARVTVAAGQLRQIKEIYAGSSLASQDSQWLIFGIAANLVTDEVRVRWPAGTQELFANIAGGQTVTLIEGQGRTFGDLNCDGAFNGGDIDPFFLALGDPMAYAKALPNCDPLLGDMNSDGRLDGGDIDPFFACLGGGACP